MNQLQAMRTFVRVVELESFVRAAEQLGMCPSAVTRSVSMLEAHLHTRLLNRTPRCLSLTEAGRTYFESARVVIAQLDDLEAGLVRSTREMRGALRVASSATFAQTGLFGLIARYQQAYPQIDFDVTVCDGDIDLLSGGHDVGFSTGRNVPDSTIVCRQLTTIDEVAVASPAYLALHGMPSNPGHLKDHRPLAAPCGPRRATWRFTHGAQTYGVDVASALRASNSIGVRSAAIAGMGIGLLPAPEVQDDLDAGRLVRVLAPFAVANGMRQLSVMYASRSRIPPRVRSFVDFTIGWYRDADNLSVLRETA
jgi:DNA-binding transcriptional LysR family regulator